MPGIKAIKVIVPALLAAAGAYAVPFQKRGMDQVITQCKHNFAYTWDDGPYIWNTDLVNKFDSVGAKTTFFVNGNNWGCIYSDANVKALRYAYEQGHEIASHTWSHPNITTLNFAQIDEEIARLDEAFVKILGVKPNLFRPPYGEINETSASYIQSKYGKTIVVWDLDSGDTAAGANEQGSVNFYKKLAKEGPNSKHLPLSHEVHDWSVKAAEDFTVDALHNAGVSLLTVAQCLDMSPYEVVGEYGERDDTWTCEGSWTGAPAATPTTTSSPPPTSTPYTSPPTTSAPPPTTSSSAPPTSAPPTSVPPTSAPPTSVPPTSVPPTSAPPTSVPPTSVPPTSVPPTSVPPTSAPPTSAPPTSVPPTSVPPTSAPPTSAPPTSAPPTSAPPTSAPPPTTPPSSVPPPTPPISAPLTTSTPLCKETYQSVVGDDCTKIEAKYNLVPGTLNAANSFVTCSDIWTGTPLCIPNGPYNPISMSTPAPAPTTTPPLASPCKQVYMSVPDDTCATMENMFNLKEGTILAANTFLTCMDIWKGTPICVPDGPYKNTVNDGGPAPSCVTQNYQSQDGETCDSIETKLALQTGSVAAANDWVNCKDIWKGTNLAICVPTLVPSDPQTCTKGVTAPGPTTCAAVGAANGVSAAWVKAWNPWVNCADIWVGTNLCVAH